MKQVNITDFVLWKSKDGFSGYAKYHGLKQYDCIIKNDTVLIKLDDGKWYPFGKYYALKNPAKVRADKDYECIGIIWTPDYTYHVLKDGNRFIAI
jgi:hypothetical protein